MHSFGCQMAKEKQTNSISDKINENSQILAADCIEVQLVRSQTTLSTYKSGLNRDYQIHVHGH